MIVQGMFRTRMNDGKSYSVQVEAEEGLSTQNDVNSDSSVML